jgi:phosphoribosylformylglycinamidine synthase PurS subunit
VRVRIEVGFKDGVLDPEAQAIAKALAGLHFSGVRELRRLKVIELELDAGDPAAAEAQARAMCDQLLANPVIESYRVSVEE